MTPSSALPLRPATPPVGLADVVAIPDASTLRVIGAVDDTLVTGVTHDSRQVLSGDLYAAFQGATAHGADFLPAVVASGARALLTDAAGADRCIETGLPTLVVPRVRDVLGPIAALVYGHPARRLTTVGITGTNGKTTTAYLVEAVLAAAHRKVGLIGTVETRIAGATVPSLRTTPEATDLHALLAVMVERGVEAVVMEVSSHALAMGRVDGVLFDVVGFTNLSQDHLDFHGDMENYFSAKAELFRPERARAAVVCVDDAWGRRLASSIQIPVTVVTKDDAPDHLQLLGEVNKQNASVAAGLVARLNIAADVIVDALRSVTGVPGRLEAVATTPVLAVVDYAHTPEAVEAVLAELRRTLKRGRLIAVLGAGGDRDHSKRPLMGAAAARGADVVIVTDDNPRSEDPASIRATLLEGAVDAEGRAQLVEVEGRSAAIDLAVAMASEGDCVVLLGKGHEQGQEIAGTLHPFDDRVELRRALEEQRP